MLPQTAFERTPTSARHRRRIAAHRGILVARSSGGTDHADPGTWGRVRAPMGVRSRASGAAKNAALAKMDPAGDR
jgi:hypothetical protein